MPGLRRPAVCGGTAVSFATKRVRDYDPLGRYMSPMDTTWFTNSFGLSLFLLSMTAPGMMLAAENSQPETIDGFRDTPFLPGSKWHLHDPDRPQPPIVAPVATFSLNAPAPSDADVLFDGKDLSKWQTAQGQDAPWTLKEGYMETAGQQGIRTRGKWA